MLNDTKLLKLLLPEYLVNHFDIVKFEEKDQVLHLYFEEKSTIPKEFSWIKTKKKRTKVRFQQKVVTESVKESHP